jgi:catechol 2,3-dioxygenase-like lactoylglutathione lyase family enzyme
MAAMPGLTHAEYTNGYDIGVGVSSFAGQARGNAITWDGDPGGPTGGFTTDAAITLATTQEDFFSSLGISAEVKASYGLGSVSAKMSYAQSFKSTKLSSWIVFRVAVSQVYRQLGPHNNPAFTADALAILASDGGALQFFQTYGDLYVTGIDAGAELMGVLQIESSSEESKQELKASWDANYSGGFSASTTGEVNKVLTSLKTTSSKMFRCHAFGGAPAALPKELSLEDLTARGLAFPDSVTTQNAVPLTVYLQDYRALYRPPGTHLSSPELDAAKALLAAINADLQTLKSANSTVQAILDYPERYVDTLADLKARYGPAQDAIQAAIVSFTGIADACVASFTNSDTPHAPDVPPAPTFSIELPPLNPDPAFAIVSALGSPPLVIGTDGQQPTPHLVLRPYNADDPSQRWIRKDLGDGHFQLIAGDTKAPISGADDPSQAPLHLVGSDANDAAGSWAAPSVGGGDACAISDASGKVFEVWDGKAQANTPICLAARSDTDQQRWLFVPMGMPPRAVSPAGVSGAGALYIDTSDAPGVVAFNGLFHLFYKDPTGQQIFHRTSPDGSHWDGEMRLYDPGGHAICTSGGPCPAVFDGQLHLFFRDPDTNGNGIMHATSPDGAQWSYPDYIGINTIGGLPSAAVLGDTLCLVARDVKNDGHPDYSSIMMYTVSKAGS